MSASARVLGPALLGLVSLGLLAGPAGAAAPAPSGIAVAPFARVLHERAGPREALLPDVAGLLARELAAQSPARIVRPRDVGGLSGRGEASAVQRLASAMRVERVVVGRTERHHDGALDVHVELRWGHSGGAEAEYRLEPGPEGLTGPIERLAGLILADARVPVRVARAPGEPAPAGAVAPPSAPVAGASAPEAAPESGERAPDSLLGDLRKDEAIAISSDELEVLPRDGARHLVFTRNVRVVRGDVTMKTHRLEAVYPDGQSQPERLIATGGVHVTQKDRRARCQRATYERSADEIVCRGKAEVVQGCDRVRGKEIRFDLEQEIVTVTGAASVLIRPEEEGGGCKEGTP